jgi:hypothetical protein
VDSILVHHAAFVEATRRIDTCFELAHETTQPICLAVIGEAGTGKSRALEACYRKHPPIRHDDGMHVPILRVTAPSRPTVKGLAEIMLAALGAPDTARGTENEKTRRVKILMRNTVTRLLMIDEFQHFYDKGTQLIMHHVADWLKILVDDVKCVLVVAGLPACRIVIDQNEQLARRFRAAIQLPRFLWQEVNHRNEFTRILKAFHKVLAGHFDLPQLHAEAMAFRCYCATGGLIGYLSAFLQQAVWDALADDRKSITLDDLNIAYERSFWDQRAFSDLPRPFARTFEMAPNVDLLHRVSRIGTIVPADLERRRNIRKSTQESVAACLVAK